MSTPNLDSRYITPSAVDAKIAAQATTDSGRYQNQVFIDATGSAYGADKSGNADSRAALVAAIAAVPSSGGTVYLPAGTYKVVATNAAQFISLGNNIRILGEVGTKIILQPDTAGAYRELFRNYGTNAVLENLSIQRGSDFPSVLINTQAYDGFRAVNCIIDGKRDVYTTNYCHGFEFPNSGTLRGWYLDRVSILHCGIPMLMQNASTATITHIRIKDCITSSVNFNAPNATMYDVVVEGNLIDGTLSPDGNFGVDFAHVTDAIVQGNTIQNAQLEGIHIEDSSARIKVIGNSLIACALSGVNSNGYINVISSASDIFIGDNYLDASSNTNATATRLISVQQGGTGMTPGGRTAGEPFRVFVHNNVMIGGANNASHGSYFEGTSELSIIGNEFVGTGTVTSGTYSGTTSYAIWLASSTGTRIIGNKFKGWSSVLNSVTATLTAGIIADNVIQDSNVGFPSGSIGSASLRNNTSTNTVTPGTLDNGAGVDVQTFTSSGTWTKPSTVLEVEAICVGGGGGGGGGARTASGTAVSGGSGGGGGGYNFGIFAAANLGATVTVTVGAGGSGGAAQTTDSTSGNNGTAGSASTFGTYVMAGGGAAGTGGSASTASGGVGGYGSNGGGAGGDAAVGAVGGAGIRGIKAGAGGGAGGGLTTTPARANGGAGGNSLDLGDTGGGTAGTTAGAWGTNGTAVPTNTPIGGPGGGGAASATSGAGGNGGAGATRGGGGGGGGSAINTSNGGAGGAGAAGMIVVISR